MLRRMMSGARLAAGLGLLAAVGVTVATTAADPPAGAAPAGRKMFPNSVVKLPAEPGLVPPQAGVAAQGLMITAAVRDHKNDKLDLHFSLANRSEAVTKLQERVLKGETVDPQEVTKAVAPKAEDFERLDTWLKTEGFEVTYVTPDKTSVYARGTVAQIEKSLAVNMVRVHKDSVEYNAARDVPSLPKDVGAGVQAIIGLQPFRQVNKRSHIKFRRPAAAAAAADVNMATAAHPGYGVKDILKSYNADNLGVTGRGQTIAVLIDRAPLASDLAGFLQANGLPPNPTQVEVRNVNKIGLPSINPFKPEETIDAEWTSGVASGAKVRVYATGSLQYAALDRGIDQILTDAKDDPGLRQVSISLGKGEQYLSHDGTVGPQDVITEGHMLFFRLAALGVNIFVSSGDGGSNPVEADGSPGGLITMTEWMASSPFVIAVGGTTMIMNPAGGVSETAWPGSGGGRSLVFDRPNFQIRPGMPNGQKRLVPDVSLVADPEPGMFVRVADQDAAFGGTSVSAPIWAGFCALINESRTRAGKPTLPFLNPLIYPLMGGPCFRDIKSGNNGAFNAKPGYDMVTGIGVPHVKNLMDQFSQ